MNSWSRVVFQLNHHPIIKSSGGAEAASGAAVTTSSSAGIPASGVVYNSSLRSKQTTELHSLLSLSSSASVPSYNILNSRRSYSTLISVTSHNNHNPFSSHHNSVSRSESNRQQEDQRIYRFPPDRTFSTLLKNNNTPLLNTTASNIRMASTGGTPKKGSSSGPRGWDVLWQSLANKVWGTATISLLCDTMF